MITVSAPGKLMLLGDHAVIYDRPCLVTAVGQRLQVTASKIDTKELRLDAPEVDLKDYHKKLVDLGKGNIPKEAEYVEATVKLFRDMYPFTGGIQIKTKSEFSAKLGFGSSSAVVVCTIKALAELYSRKITNREVFDLSLEVVRQVKGVGSGYDLAAATFGGTQYYVTGGKDIKLLHIEDLPLIVGYTGEKVDTATIVRQVAGRMKNKKHIYTKTFDLISRVVEEALECLIHQDLKGLGQLMNINQGLLSAIDVSSGKLDLMNSISREAGAYGAKLSGAGIGDCMIALAPESKADMIKEMIGNVGGKVINIKTNVPGVKVE